MPATFLTETPVVWMVFLAFWITMETLAVTVGLHRLFTHRAFNVPRRAALFWLWWARSGMVRYWEWVNNHLWHHAHTDTDVDSYTPWKHNRLTGMPPLRRPLPWRFLDNARSYTKMADYLTSHPEKMVKLASSDPTVRRSVKYMAQFDDVRQRYGNVWFAFWLNLAVFTAAAAVWAVPSFGVWWGLLLAHFMAWLATGIKVYIYLLGGYIINYWGHQKKSSPHQSNIPRRLMLVTFWTMGEGWHEFHHKHPSSARFHPHWDPGWWVICVMRSLRLAKNVRYAQWVR